MEKSIVLLLVLLVISNSEYSLLSPVLPEMLKEKGVEKWSGLIFSVYAVAMTVTSFFVGGLIDRIGHRAMIITGTTILALSIISFGAEANITEKFFFVFLLTLSRIFQGIAIAMINTTTWSYAAIAFPEEVEKNMSLFEAMIGLGIAIGPFLGSILF